MFYLIQKTVNILNNFKTENSMTVKNEFPIDTESFYTLFSEYVENIFCQFYLRNSDAIKI